MPNARVIYEASASAAWYTPAWLRELAADVLGGAVHVDTCTGVAVNPLQALITWNVRRPLRATVTGLELADLVELELQKCAALVGGEPLTFFQNPPYGLGVALWRDRLAACLEELERRGRACASLELVPARVGAQWYKRATLGSDVVCELDGRVTYEVWRHGRLQPKRDKAGRPSPARWGCVLLYNGRDRAAVARKLRPYGATRFGREARALRSLKPAANVRQLTMLDNQPTRSQPA